MSNHGDMQNKYFGDCYDIHNVQAQYKGVGTSGGALGLSAMPSRGGVSFADGNRRGGRESMSGGIKASSMSKRENKP